MLKPWICDDCFEQCFTLFHSVLKTGFNGSYFSPLSIDSFLTSLSDSKRIWSYSDKATRKMIDVTFSKQWIHFRRSDRWPPTSTMLKGRERENDYYYVGRIRNDGCVRHEIHKCYVNLSQQIDRFKVLLHFSTAVTISKISFLLILAKCLAF